jgi:hypothetical protein
MVVDSQTHKLDILSSQIFSDLRTQFEERGSKYPKDHQIKFLSILWVAQEMLKAMIYNPPWDRITDRPQVRELRWDDERYLLMETAQNTRSLLAQIPDSNRRGVRESRPAKKRRASTPQPPPPSYTQVHDPPNGAKQEKSKPKVVRKLVNSVRKMFGIKNSKR